MRVPELSKRAATTSGGAQNVNGVDVMMEPSDVYIAAREVTAKPAEKAQDAHVYEGGENRKMLMLLSRGS